MSDFLDDLFAPINALFRKPTPLEDRLPGEGPESLKLTGISNSVGGTPSNNASPRHIPTADLAGIIQKRERAFNVFDVTPYNLSSTQFRPQLSIEQIKSKVGYEADNDVLSGNPTGISLAFWRTIELPVPGTSFKFEFLPAQVNFPFYALGVVPGDATSPENYSKQDLTNPYLLNSSMPRNIPPRTDFLKLMGSRTILVQFDDPGSTPFLVKDGDVINVPFQRAYITFKIYLPRFSVMLGYNAEIKSPSDNRLMQSQLATGPGFGMWNNPSRHPVPFCFTQDDQAVPTVASSFSADVTVDIFDLDNISPTTYGLGTLWITNFSFRFYPEVVAASVTGTPTTGAGFSLYTADQSGNRIKLILSGTVRRRVEAATIANANDPMTYDVNFSTPQRVTLSKWQQSNILDIYVPKLRLFLDYQVSGTIPTPRVEWTLNGYTFGPINKLFRVATSSFQYGLDLLTSPPFPIDPGFAVTGI